MKSDRRGNLMPCFDRNISVDGLSIKQRIFSNREFWLAILTLKGSGLPVKVQLHIIIPVTHCNCDVTSLIKQTSFSCCYQGKFDQNNNIIHQTGGTKDQRTFQCRQGELTGELTYITTSVPASSTTNTSERLREFRAGPSLMWSRERKKKKHSELSGQDYRESSVAGPRP